MRVYLLYKKMVKGIYRIENEQSDLSFIYGIAASFVYLGNLIFRLGHNFFFFMLSPRMRVVISQISMTFSMGFLFLLFVLYDWFNPKKVVPPIIFAFLAFGFGGIGIGTFESNLLSSIAPLGKNTKLWAIIAIPIGIIMITVFGFILLEYGVNVGVIFLCVFVFNIVGLFVYQIRVFKLATTSAVPLSVFWQQIKHFRRWAPKIVWHSIALMVDMFCVSLFSPGVLLFLYDEPTVSIIGFKLDTKWLFAIYDTLFSIGDTLSRQIFYQRKIIFPFAFWLFSITGVFFGLLYKPYLAPICAFLVAFANGSIYAQANRQIDSKIEPEFSLVSFSFWLFCGDVGSVIGSNLILILDLQMKLLYHHN